ncbi:hypothetical protein CEJ32_07415 [Enterobacter sp. 9-2]|nr:hypothetical protein CEJ32_07415 [Enterobacter sp. 9-2]
MVLTLSGSHHIFSEAVSFAYVFKADYPQIIAPPTMRKCSSSLYRYRKVSGEAEIRNMDDNFAFCDTDLLTRKHKKTSL